MRDVTRQQLSRRSVLRLLAAALPGGLVGIGRLGTVGALGALTGCHGSQSHAGRTPNADASGRTTIAPRPAATGHPANPDDAVAHRAAGGERALLDAYDTAIARYPQLASALRPLRADHAAHLVALAPGSMTTTPSATAMPSASTVPPSAKPAPAESSSGSAAASSAGNPAAASAAASASALALVRRLADLEKAAAAARVDDVLAASAGLARLLASIGGCEAAHAAVLGTLR